MPTGIYIRTEEHKRKTGLVHKGCKPWNTGKQWSLEVKNKLRQANLNKMLSEETKRKISESNKGKHTMTEEHKIKFGYANKGRKHSLETRQKISIFSKGRKHSEAAKLKISSASKTHWQNPEYAQKILTSLHKLPTKPEIYLTNFLNIHFQNQFKYVGDGQVIIAGKNPDFINVNGKKQIIEYDETYWHKDKNKQIDRANLFKQFGFSTLSLNENDLKDENKLKKKIGEFNARYVK